MGIFKKRAATGNPGPERSVRDDSPESIVVGDGDLAALGNLLDQYSKVGGLGNELSDPVVIAMARAGGSGPIEEIFEDVVAGRQDPDKIWVRQDRPWYWMWRVAGEAVRREKELLALRIASFVGMWADDMDPLLGAGDVTALGIAKVPSAVQVGLAEIGLVCAESVPPEAVAAADATGLLLAGQSLLGMSLTLVRLAEKGLPVDPRLLDTARRNLDALGED